MRRLLFYRQHSTCRIIAYIRQKNFSAKPPNMPVLSSLMQMADKMSASLPILAMQAGISSAVRIVLANAVAYASASAQLLHTIIIASAFPKLN